MSRARSPHRNPTCAEVVELVSAYLDGELDDATALGVAEHVEECAGCGPYLTQFQETMRLIGGVAPDAVDGGIRDRLLAAFAERGADDR